ncbi:MAG: crotonase/enoyl-CoA hydratase family protein [Alphaproteobacteria bacterium]|nr:crotonase/enoyl-CoA hydratase family protein [Alphaproteobacteria bacterium]MCB9931494.1 crotonase/enoyl-CoA hydratase family protein [Alphaproteobacteria bacterium]
MSSPVAYTLADGIATLAMDDGKANAMAPAMSAALNAGLDRAAKEGARAVVIRGRPGLLSGGFDLKIIRGDDEALKAQMRDAGMALLKRLYLSPLPIVFAVTGHAVAMGALLLFAGDVRIGLAGDFRIGLNEVGIGLSLPIAGIELARDRLLPTELSRAIVYAQLYRPDEAAAVGYLDQVATADAFDDRVRMAAEALAALDPAAFAETKRRLRQPTLDRIAALGA